ncbi:MAG: Gmad2 immunoglobulin-like domain-containing protein [Candidatus Paceibacterota bacterium]
MKKYLKIILIIGVLIILGCFIFVSPTNNEPLPSEINPLIRVEYPQPNDLISSPLSIKGEARGYWFFESVAPVVLVDWDGLIIAQGHIQAMDDWMTEDFVNFEGVLEFKKPEIASKTDFGKNGALILKRDNPSGLPENDSSVEIPVKFSNQ